MPSTHAPPVRARTVVAICPHPDDETLLIGGTLARSVAQGHHVIVVLATDGGEGLAAAGTGGLAVTRHREVRAATAALGVSATIDLGYRDSGYRSPVAPPPGSLAATPVELIAERLSTLFAELRPDVLLVPDERGGYGHRDHLACHQAGLAAAAVSAVPRVLQATLPRERLCRAVRLMNLLGIRPGGFTADDLAAWYTPAKFLTHALDIRQHLPAKQKAIAAHQSQMTGGRDLRTMWLLARLPRPVAAWVLGTEWYVEVGASRAGKCETELFGGS